MEIEHTLKLGLLMPAHGLPYLTPHSALRSGRPQIIGRIRQLADDEDFFLSTSLL